MLEVLILALLWPSSFGDEAIYTINGKKPLHTVSEKFVSFSIDPAVLLTGLNLSDTTLQMAKHLSPAYVRIAGPSTQFVKYQHENWKDEESGVLAVTPTMWFGINEWLTAANLTPVFGINDGVSGKDGWNPQEAMGVLDIADKFNVSCYWQLGYDCSNKTEGQYETDLRRLQHVLDAFPDRKNQWKIVGSDLTQCVSDPRRVLENLSDTLAAVVLENATMARSIFFADFHLKPKVPLWVIFPKCPHPASFASAISWAKETGEAAKNGYEVVMRQPRLHEMYSETPPFWVSAFHKMLMGKNVLDVKTTFGHPQVEVYAHCTKHQNDFNRSGAMTVLVVNNCTTNHTILLKFGAVLLKSTEVQSYVLTAESEDATDVFVNDEKLSMEKYIGDKLDVAPKLRRARILNYLSLFLPPKSIGFFVLPGAQIPVCVNEEADAKLLMEEISEDQKIPFSGEEVSVEVGPRFKIHKSPTLRELQQLMEKELESDERYYKRMKVRNVKKHDENKDGRNFFIQHIMKHKQEDAKRVDLKHEEVKHPDFKFEDIRRHRQHKEEEPKRIFELELTSAEIRKVLADRAKVKAAKKNIVFTSEELEDIMDKATRKFLNNKNASIRIKKKSKREVRDKKDINMKLLRLKTLGDRKRLRESLRNRNERVHMPTPVREKRDINMHLLKLRTEMLQSNNKHKKIKRKEKFENLGEKQATIREPGETSDELLEYEEEEEREESLLPDEDIFAELAKSAELFSPTTEKIKGGLKRKSLIVLHKPIVPRINVEPIKHEPNDKPVFEDDFEMTSAFDDTENFDCIHEFFGRSKNPAKEKISSSELWEVGPETDEKTTRSHNNLPSLTNRLKVIEQLEDKNQNFGYIENDYDELESDESSPVRLKRDINKSNPDNKFHFVLGPGYDAGKIKIDDNLKNQQYKILKDRLAYKKKIDFINKNNELIRRNGRSLLGKSSFNERYKSLTEGLKIWKPSDILTLKDRNVMRSKRSVDHDVDSVENEIGNFVKEIMKMDTANGDYQLVFPNKDKIEVVDKPDDAEVKLVLHGDGTCPTTVKEETEVTTKSNIQKISKKESNVWDKLFRKLSKFFQGLSAKLKRCIIDDLLQGV